MNDHISMAAAADIVAALTALRDDYTARAAAADADRNYMLSAYLTAKRDGVHDAIHEARMAAIVSANAAAVTA